MNVKAMIPSPVEVGREALIVLGGVPLAAFILSRLPKLSKFVTDQSITVKDATGNVFW